MGIEGRLESTRDSIRDLESEVEGLKDRVRILEGALSRLARERHDKAIESGDTQHEGPFRRCTEDVCAAERGE